MKAQSLFWGGLWILLVSLVPVTAMAEVIRKVEDIDGLKVPAYPPLSAFSGIRQRPLFSEDRKPRMKSKTSRGNGNEQKLRETWRLTGVLITPERLVALFEEREGPRRVRLEQGMALDNSWQLEEVRSDGVSVSSGATEVWLELHQPRQPMSAAAQARTVEENRSRQSDTPAAGSTENSVKQSAAGGKAQTM